MNRVRQPLKPGNARCPATRQVPCDRACECARGVEPHAKGRPAQDFSIEPRGAGGCGWFMAIIYAEAATATQEAHEAPQGLC